MIVPINKNISIWKEHNPFEFEVINNNLNPLGVSWNSINPLFNRERIEIRDRWFDILNDSELIRKRNDSDGYYRVVYVQINMETGEYYIGKVNRPNWRELKRYQGSGLKFNAKFKKDKDKFVRYYIATCETQHETEELEASIVCKELISDEYCLNLVAGGGGTTNRPTMSKSREKKRKYMLDHPEQYRPMLEGAKKAFQSGDTPSLRERSYNIKKSMNTEEHRQMTSKRIKKWIKEDPEAYAQARKRNVESIRSEETKAKQAKSRKKWIEENPKECKAWQEKFLKSRTTPEAKAKRKASLRRWSEENPEQAKANSLKRSHAAAAKRVRGVCMLDLQSGEVLKAFSSGLDAAKWLVEKGIAKNTNCKSSISAVCLSKPCANGDIERKPMALVGSFRKKLSLKIKCCDIGQKLLILS